MASIRPSAWMRRVTLAALLTSAALAAYAQQEAIQARRAAMKANGQALMHIDRMIRTGGDPAAIIDPANRIAAMAGQIPGLFPTGSGKGDAAADPEIWQHFGDFEDKAANLQSQATLLGAAARAGDPATIRAQFDKVVQACGDCHKPYRHQRW